MFHEEALCALQEDSARGRVIWPTSAKAFVEQNPGFRISLLHLDVDLYEPTLAALELSTHWLVKGGVVVMDEYGYYPVWLARPARSRNISEARCPGCRKFPLPVCPRGFFIKE